MKMMMIKTVMMMMIGSGGGGGDDNDDDNDDEVSMMTMSVGKHDNLSQTNKVVGGESCIGSVDRDSLFLSRFLCFTFFPPVITMRGSGRAPTTTYHWDFHREFTTYHCARVVDSRW